MAVVQFGFGDDSLVLERIFRIDFRDHQRNGVNHAERAGVVNHTQPESTQAFANASDVEPPALKRA